jgi:dienelactone hydrolase
MLPWYFAYFLMFETKYSQWLNRWEERLAFRSTDRVVRPFEWGLDWSKDWPLNGAREVNGSGPAQLFAHLSDEAIANSDRFFAHTTPTDFSLRDGILRFTSPVATPYPENNLVHGQWFPAKQTRKAVLVLPHWNAPGHAHNAFARGFQKFGVSALRLSLPYHDFRMPAELGRADYAMSANIGRTIDATRQAVLDIRAAVDWLQQQGAERIAIVGTSLGSCYAFLASAHDERIQVNAFNHCSTYVADVVWSGLSTLHVKKSLEGVIDLPELRKIWTCISPTVYFDKYAAKKKKSLFLYTKYDTTFLPELSEQTVAQAREYKLDHKVIVLPCGHYTLGETPFKYVDGYQVVSFVLRNL